MKQTISRLCLIMIVLMAATACKQAPVLPAESSEPVLEKELLPTMITADDNAGQQTPTLPIETSEPVSDQELLPTVTKAENAPVLKLVFSAPVRSGYFNAKWVEDNSSIWVFDTESAALYDSASGEMTAQFTPGENAVVYDVSPDGKTLAYSRDGVKIHLFDISTQADILSIQPDYPLSSAFFNIDGTLLGTNSRYYDYDVKIYLWDTASGEETGILRGFDDGGLGYGASFGMDGKTLLWSAFMSFQAMDITTKKMGPILPHGDLVSGKITTDGKVIGTISADMVEGEYQPVLTLWDADSGEILHQNVVLGSYNIIAFSPDSSLLAAGIVEGVLFFTVPDGDEVLLLGSMEAVADLAFSPDGTKLLTCGAGGTLTIYEVNE